METGSTNSDDGGEAEIREAFNHLDQSQILVCHLLRRAYILIESDLYQPTRSRAIYLQQHCEWNIRVLTEDDFEMQISTAIALLSDLEGLDEELAQLIVEHGILSYSDLVLISCSDLMKICKVDEHRAKYILHEAKLRD